MNNMSYEEMLRVWRFAPLGSTLFTGEHGEEFLKVMKEKKALLPQEDQVRISKKVGWVK